MEKLKRKDVLLIAILTLSCVFFAVSKPDTIETRDVVWNYSFMVVLFSTLFWFLSEMFGWATNLAMSGPVIKADVSTMSKNGLVLLAEQEGLGDRKTLEGLTEEDIVALLNNKAGKTIKTHDENMILAIIKRVIFLIKGIITRLRVIIKNTVSAAKKSPKTIGGLLNKYLGGSSGKKKRKR